MAGDPHRIDIIKEMLKVLGILAPVADGRQRHLPRYLHLFIPAKIFRDVPACKQFSEGSGQRGCGGLGECNSGVAFRDSLKVPYFNPGSSVTSFTVVPRKYRQLHSNFDNG